MWPRREKERERERALGWSIAVELVDMLSSETQTLEKRQGRAREKAMEDEKEDIEEEERKESGYAGSKS